MSVLMKKIAPACALAILVLLAGAGRAEALRLDYTASQDGFQFRYYIPFLGFGKVDLSGPEAPPKDVKIRFLFFRLFNIQLSISSMEPDAEPPKLTLHYDISSPYFTPPVPSGDIPVPFGQAGFRLKLFRKWFLWTPGNDMDVRLLLTRRKSKYNLDFNLPALKGTWEAEATRDGDNQIQETVKYQGLTFAEINLTFGYTPAFITKINYSILITPNPVTAPDNSTAFDGSIALPNGSYHIWYNSVQ